MKKAFVGTSGFSYRGWVGKFYPADLPQSKQLEFYSEHFNSVEINSSFYHLPKRATYENWLKRTPDEFRFVIKGSRYITQFLRLSNTTEAINKFFEPAEALDKKLAVVLWQLPPGYKADAGQLKSFITDLHRNKTARKVRHAFEFRNVSWFIEEVYDILREHNCGFVIAHSKRWPSAEAVTAGFIYLRFHGVPQLFYSNYSDEDLMEWAVKAKKWARGRDVFAYFNNDANGHAPSNAQTLGQMLRQKTQNLMSA